MEQIINVLASVCNVCGRCVVRVLTCHSEKKQRVCSVCIVCVACEGWTYAGRNSRVFSMCIMCVVCECWTATGRNSSVCSARVLNCRSEKQQHVHSVCSMPVLTCHREKQQHVRWSSGWCWWRLILLLSGPRWWCWCPPMLSWWTSL